MKIADFVSGLGLQSYAEVALIIFMVVFAGVAVRLMVRGRRDAWDRASQLPLDDGETHE